MNLGSPAHFLTTAHFESLNSSFQVWFQLAIECRSSCRKIQSLILETLILHLVSSVKRDTCDGIDERGRW